ncbi:hypothetical protein VP01_952g1 [Puccinia sorghi]|uniref:Uncharacterized protein n=1 Tax=Puccinia sorghi TaxID=27349 RepID=A0A0L6U6B3_9BASI|nr:hypothetical protein VP01_952g1 [Puccinia sorghi]
MICLSVPVAHPLCIIRPNRAYIKNKGIVLESNLVFPSRHLTCFDIKFCMVSLLNIKYNPIKTLLPPAITSNQVFTLFVGWFNPLSNKMNGKQVLLGVLTLTFPSRHQIQTSIYLCHWNYPSSKSTRSNHTQACFRAASSAVEWNDMINSNHPVFKTNCMSQHSIVHLLSSKLSIQQLFLGTSTRLYTLVRNKTQNIFLPLFFFFLLSFFDDKLIFILSVSIFKSPRVCFLLPLFFLSSSSSLLIFCFFYENDIDITTHQFPNSQNVIANLVALLGDMVAVEILPFELVQKMKKRRDELDFQQPPSTQTCRMKENFDDELFIGVFWSKSERNDVAEIFIGNIICIHAGGIRKGTPVGDQLKLVVLVNHCKIG